MNALKILVTGGNGQLGQALGDCGAPETIIVRLGQQELDITRSDQVHRVLAEVCCDVVINAAAYTAVDGAERETEQAFAVNRDGAAHLARACAEHRLPLIHLSSDYVFDGQSRHAYVETDAVNPLGVYGASKAAGEEAVRQIAARHVIVRAAWLFGRHGRSFVKTMLDLAATHKQVRVVADQRGSPTPAEPLAAALVSISRQCLGRDGVPWGTYHLAGAPSVTWFGLAEAVFVRLSELGQTVPHLEAVTSEVFGAPAVRPAFSVLDGGKAQRTFGIEPFDWQKGLAVVIDDYLRHHPLEDQHEDRQ
ncbi:MAG: dTDP-4-dehydrorhamnose reductase [Pseudomonadota bacterium]